VDRRQLGLDVAAAAADELGRLGGADAGAELDDGGDLTLRLLGGDALERGRGRPRGRGRGERRGQRDEEGADDPADALGRRERDAHRGCDLRAACLRSPYERRLGRLRCRRPLALRPRLTTGLP
jgi:hypothetical protein